MGGSSIALPMPFSARINSEGHVAVNFLGMGVMADFYLVLDSTNPGNSLMVVVRPDGFVHQYLLSLPHKKNRAHWVPWNAQGPDTWKSLGGSRNSKGWGVGGISVSNIQYPISVGAGGSNSEDEVADFADEIYGVIHHPPNQQPSTRTTAAVWQRQVVLH